MWILKFVASYSEIQVTWGPWKCDWHMKWRLMEDWALSVWGEQYQSELQYTTWGGDKMSWDSGQNWTPVFHCFCPAEREESSNHMFLLKPSTSGNHLDSHMGTSDFSLPHSSLDIVCHLSTSSDLFLYLLVVKFDDIGFYPAFWQLCLLCVSFHFVFLLSQLCLYSPCVLPWPPGALCSALQGHCTKSP